MDEHSKKLGYSSIPIHSGPEGKNSEYHPVNTPVFFSSTFAFPTQADGAAIFTGDSNAYTYGRLANPTIVDAEKRLAALEGADDCALFASGMAAISTMLQCVLKSGDHAIADITLYGGTHSTFTHKMPERNVDVTFVDTADIDAVKHAIRKNTKLIYFETPTNPTMRVVPIAPIVELAQKHSIMTAIDATFMTPILMRPLEMGVDIVVHSVTKYLNGHSDMIGGAVLSNEELMGEIKMERVHLGGMLGPMDAYLLSRGMKTLKIRMKEHEKNGKVVADFLKTHNMVKSLNFIGHEDHPGYQTALKQQKGFGSMMTFELDGDYDMTVKFVNSLRLITRAVSLGGVESLISHPASTTHSDLVVSQEDKLKAGITDTLMRLSVGIEDVEDIIDDLKQAFTKIQIQTMTAD